MAKNYTELRKRIDKLHKESYNIHRVKAHENKIKFSRPRTKGEKGNSMERITRAEFDRIGADFKGIWHDYWGDHPEWKGRRVAFLPGHGTTLFIEGVSFEIVDDKRK